MSERLPPELWLQILEIACAIPGELNTSAASLFDRPPHLDAFNARSEILPTRRSLPRVSRLFHQLANPLLYQSISLRRGGTFRSLMKTLKKVDALSELGQPIQSHGCWVKRLDVDFRRLKPWTKSDFEEIYEIYSYIRNMEVFVAIGSWLFLDGGLLASRLSYCSHLRNLALPSDVLPKIHDPMFRFITHTPTIRTYFPTPTTRALSKQPYVFQDPEKCKDLIAVTSSDTWLLGYAEHNAQFFPHLNTLHWYDSVNLNLIRTHGFKIKTIDLESTEWADVAPYLEYLPNVQRVIIDIQATNNYIYAALTRGQVELVVCTTVKVVGVTAYSKQPPRKQYNALFMSLPDIFPALERVRILENVSVKNLSSQPRRVLRWHEYFIQRNIRLEREDGELLIQCIEQAAGIGSR